MEFVDRTEDDAILESDANGVLTLAEKVTLSPGADALKKRKQDEILGPVEWGPEKKGFRCLIGALISLLGVLSFFTMFLNDVSVGTWGGLVANSEKTMASWQVLVAEFAATLVCFTGFFLFGRGYLKRGGANCLFRVGFREIGDMTAGERKAMHMQGFDAAEHHRSIIVYNMERTMQYYQKKGIIGLIMVIAGGIGAAMSANILGLAATFLCMICAVIGFVWVFDWRVNAPTLLSVFYSRKLRRRNPFEELILNEAMHIQLQEEERKYNNSVDEVADEKRKKTREDRRRRLMEMRVAQGMDEEEAEVIGYREEVEKGDVDEQLAALFKDLKREHPILVNAEPEMDAWEPEEPIARKPENNTEKPIAKKPEVNPTELVIDSMFDETPAAEPEPEWTTDDEALRVDKQTDEDWEYWEKYYHK